MAIYGEDLYEEDQDGVHVGEGSSSLHKEAELLLKVAAKANLWMGVYIIYIVNHNSLTS